MYTPGVLVCKHTDSSTQNLLMHEFVEHVAYIWLSILRYVVAVTEERTAAQGWTLRSVHTCHNISNNPGWHTINSLHNQPTSHRIRVTKCLSASTLFPVLISTQVKWYHSWQSSHRTISSPPSGKRQKQYTWNEFLRGGQGFRGLGSQGKDLNSPFFRHFRKCGCKINDVGHS